MRKISANSFSKTVEPSTESPVQWSHYVTFFGGPNNLIRRSSGSDRSPNLMSRDHYLWGYFTDVYTTETTNNTQWPGRDDLARKTDTYRLTTSNNFRDAVTCQLTRCHIPEDCTLHRQLCAHLTPTTVNMTSLFLVITSNQPHSKLGSRNVVVVLALPLTAFCDNEGIWRTAGLWVPQSSNMACWCVLSSEKKKLLLNSFSCNKRYYNVPTYRKFLFIPVSGWQHSNTEPLKSENQRPTVHVKKPVSFLTEAQLLKRTDEY